MSHSSRRNRQVVIGLLLSVIGLAIVDPAGAEAAKRKPKVTVSDASVVESGGTAVVSVKLSRKSKRRVRIAYATADGSAAAGSDYGAKSGTVDVPPRRKRTSLEVPLISDSADEPEETLVLELTSVRRAKLRDGRAEITIADDDPQPTLAVTTTSVPEGNSPAEGHQLGLSLSAASGRPVEFRYATAGGSATSGTDFTPASGRLTIPPGEATATIPLSTVGDLTDEPDEDLALLLTDPVAVALPGGAPTLTIDDDDAPPSVSITTTSIAEGTSGNHARSLTAALSAPSAKPVQVDYATTGGTAVSGTDFLAATGQLSFAPGEDTDTFDVSTVGDYADELDEDFTVGFSSPVNVQLPGSPQAVTITDDDPACVSEDVLASAGNLGSVSGDTGNGQLTSADEISPCGDTDWHRFTLTENSSAPGSVDLTAAISLSMAPNDSPSGGDLDLCAQIGVTGTPLCSTLSGSSTEVVQVCINDDLGPDDSSELFIEVDGFGNAVNDYSLQVFGNVVTSLPRLGDC